MQNIWYLYNQSTEQKYERISLSGLVEEIKKDPADLSKWYAWREEMSEWIMIRMIPEIVQELEKSNNQVKKSESTPPKIPQVPKLPVFNKVNPISTNAETRNTEPSKLHSIDKTQIYNMSCVSADTVATGVPIEKRKHQRHLIKLKIIISCEGKTFRSYTKDVSLGGVMLQDPIPAEMQNKLCEIFISNIKGNRNIKFSCQVISNQKKPTRLSFQDKEYAVELESWLQEAKLISKKAA